MRFLPHILFLAVFGLVNGFENLDVIESCQNGGFKASANLCNCPPYFEGDDCSKIACINGGFVKDGDKICTCPPGYAGIHCEAVQTAAPSWNPAAISNTFNIINCNMFTYYWGQETYKVVNTAVVNHLTAYPGFYSSNIFLESNDTESLDSNDNPLTNVGFDYTDVGTLGEPKEDKFYSCYQLPIYQQIVRMVREKSLTQTTITIITQHPPTDDLFDIARQTVAGYRVKINVVFISDEIFMDCSGQQDSIAKMRKFAQGTGGIFATVKLGSTNLDKLLEAVFASHVKSQVVAAGSWDTCDGAVSTLQFTQDSLFSANQQYYFVFEGDNVRPAPSVISDCNLNLQLNSLSFDKRVRTFATNISTASCPLPVNADGPCTAKVFAPVTTGLTPQVYFSFVEDVVLDTSRTALTEKQTLYPVVHVDSSATTPLTSATFLSSSSPTNLFLQQRTASFEWAPDSNQNATICDASKPAYMKLQFSVNTVVIQRFYRVLCFEAMVPLSSSTVETTIVTSTAAPVTSPTSTMTSTTPLPTTTTVAMTSTSSESTTTGPGTTPSPTCAPLFGPAKDKTFSFAYATDVAVTTFKLAAGFISNFVEPSPFKNFGLLRFDANDGEVYNVSTDTGAYGSALQTTYSVNATIARTDLTSDVITQITTKITKNMTENSALFVFINRLPKTTETFDSSDYTNRNIKIFTMISSAALNEQKDSLGPSSGNVFDLMAALTNGHHIVADDSITFDSQGNPTSTHFQIFQTLLNDAASQELMFSRNVLGKRAALGVVQLGQIDLTAFQGNVDVVVTATVAVDDQLSPLIPSIMTLGISGTPRVLINLLQGNLGQSNFFVRRITLAGGSLHTTVLQLQPASNGQFPDVLIRIWVKRSAVESSASYVDLQGNDVSNPDDVNGAALRLLLQGGNLNTTTIRISNCAGSSGTKYDANQLAILPQPGASSNCENDYFFAPYFCDSNVGTDCLPGTAGKYDVQIVSQNFSMSRSFTCSKSATPATCAQKDQLGNNECPGDPPYKHGPTGQVIDCSGNGQLLFQSQDGTTPDDYANQYICKCDPGFTGLSCEVGVCDKPNTDPLNIDSTYRTYTVVLASNEINASPLAQLPDSGSLFGLAGASQNLDNIWKYQLIVYCNDGSVNVIYSGSSRSDFTNAFDVGSAACNPSNDQIDLTTMFQVAANGVGRNVRGIIVFYTEEPAILNVTLNNFLKISQQYQQQIFVFTAGDAATDLPTDIRLAALSTGGVVMQSELGSIYPVGDKTFIPEMLSSSVSTSFISNTMQASFDVTIDQPSWLLVGNVLQTSILIDGAPPPTTCTLVSSNKILMCKLTTVNKKHTISTQGAHSTTWTAVVYTLNGVTPVAKIVALMSDDSSTAVSTTVGAGGTLAVHVPEGYTLAANSDFRVAQRQNCLLSFTAYNVFQPFPVGPNFVPVTLKKGATTLTRYFVVATSSENICKNGGTPLPLAGNCLCPDGFSGPDCSQIHCVYGKPNAWNDACNCENAFGRSCSSTASFAWY